MEAALRFIGITWPVLRAQEFGAVQHAVDRPRHFNSRVHEGLATFAGGLQRERFGAVLHKPHNIAQNVYPSGRREPSIPIPIQGIGRRKRSLHDASVACIDRGKQSSIVGRRNVSGETCRFAARYHEGEVIRHWFLRNYDFDALVLGPDGLNY
jgi:hypothetical protein